MKEHWKKNQVPAYKINENKATKIIETYIKTSIRLDNPLMK